MGILCLLVATLVTLTRNDPPPAPSAREGAESHNDKNGRIGGATLVALTTWESHIKSAVKTAPPKIPFVMLSVSETSLLDSL